MSIATEYRLQDELGILFDAYTVTTTVKSNAIDFGRAGGCGHNAIKVTLSSVDTGDTATIKLYESSDNSSYSEVAGLVRLVGIGNGDFLILVNNKILTLRYAKIEIVPAGLATGASMVIDAHIEPIRGLAA